jgi:hypothetical protein
VSKNSKTGPIPVSTTEQSSCPTTCAFLKDCYASRGPLAMHWAKVPERGVPWREFCLQVAALPLEAFWRHDQAGDLPADADGELYEDALAMLVLANEGKQGFTYTHHPLSPHNVAVLLRANAAGFTVNVSCETQRQVDYAKSLGLPAVLVIEHDAVLPKGATTPNGNPLRHCPAETSSMTCVQCGVCARSDRESSIMFRAHGSGAKRISLILAAVKAAERARLAADTAS